MEKALTKSEFLNILDERDKKFIEKRKKSNRFLLIFAILIIIVYILVGYMVFKIILIPRIIESSTNAYQVVMNEKNTKYITEWFYSCPSYIDPYYRCEQTLKFQNMTGFYCNKTIVCENSYKIHLKDNRTE